MSKWRAINSIVFNERADVICSTTSSDYGEKRSHTEDQELARLIAAAPDLLEACKLALHYLALSCEATQPIQDAIIKATGEEYHI